MPVLGVPDDSWQLSGQGIGLLSSVGKYTVYKKHCYMDVNKLYIDLPGRYIKIPAISVAPVSKFSLLLIY